MFIKGLKDQSSLKIKVLNIPCIDDDVVLNREITGDPRGASVRNHFKVHSTDTSAVKSWKNGGDDSVL